jgi:hypothetical protein
VTAQERHTYAREGVVRLNQIMLNSWIGYFTEAVMRLMTHVHAT